MTSSGLDDFFIPDEDDEDQGTMPPPSDSVIASATQDVHAPLVSGTPGPLSMPAAGTHAPGAQGASSAPAPQPMSPQTAPAPARPDAGTQVPARPGFAPSPTPAPRAEAAPVPPATPPKPAAPVSAGFATAAPAAAAPTAPARPARTREEQLSAALATFMRVSSDVEATALVSLDGFTMASALPAGMQEDRVGAMSAAILGLGERAALELGRGKLSQVFIEGDTGYVLLMAAGDRAVLTALARLEAKLGLLLYDMRDVAEAIADILG